MALKIQRTTVRGARRRARATAGVGAFPYLLLAPAVVVLAVVFVYPLLDGIRASTELYRFGHAIESVGLQNYADALNDDRFRAAMVRTLTFVTVAVGIETVLGVALALLCLKEIPFIRSLRTILILPMVIMPVVVSIIFRLLYASDTGLLSLTSEALGGGPVTLLTQSWSAFIAIVALDVWEWTPLVFLIVLAGLQSLPEEPLEAARVDGARGWRLFRDHTLPMVMPVILVAVTLRVIDAFATFDAVFLLTRGGPGTSTELISVYGYETAFKFKEIGYAAAMFLMVTLILLALAFGASRLIHRATHA